MERPFHYPNQDGDDPPWGERGFRHQITYQGALLIWQIYPYGHFKRRPKKRKEVGHFTRATRLRMIKKVATINWEETPNAHFLTLTYPDHYHDSHYYQRSMHRALFHRSMESHYGKHLSALWRVEFKNRLTGKYVGELAPHLHMIYFREKHISNMTANDLWCKAIGWDDYVNTCVKKMTNPRQVGFYVSKYLGKTDCILGNASYRSKEAMGRQWGVLRKTEFPQAECRVGRFQDSWFLDQCREHCLTGYTPINEWGNESFTIIGEKAKLIGSLIFDSALDGEEARG